MTLAANDLSDVLRELLKANMTALIDIHAFPCGSSVGTYNGVFPAHCKFWENKTASKNGLALVENMLFWFDDLDGDLKAVVHGFTLMNEPGFFRYLKLTCCRIFNPGLRHVCLILSKS